MNGQQEVLSHPQIRTIVTRLAHQVVEHHFEEKHLVLVGIKNKGYTFAQLLFAEVDKLVKEVNLPCQTSLAAVSIDKNDPQSSVKLSENFPYESEASVVVVDDVLYTGKTLFYALRPFYELSLKKLSTLVLVDREYRKFPVSADWTGYCLSTTVQDHVDVLINEANEMQVLLR